MKKTLLFIFQLLFATSFSQTNYFVKPTGNDNANGLSIGTAWQTIQKAANTVPPGSYVNILAGTYNELITINVSGTFNSPIFFRNYQNDEVIIHPPTSVSTAASLLTITNKNYIYIDGLILENLSVNDARGIYVSNSRTIGMNGIVLSNLVIRNIKYTNNLNPIPASNDQAHAILFVGRGDTQNTVISNIIVNNCTINNNVTGYGESVTITGNVANYLVGNNFIFNNSNIGMVAAGNYQYNNTNNNLPTDYDIPPQFNHARYGLITGNIVYNNLTPNGIDDNAGIYCDGCHDTTIEKNDVYNNKIGISVGCEKENGTTQNVIVKNNIIYNNLLEGIQFGGSNQLAGIVSNSKVSNNTCFKNDSSNLTRGEIKITKIQNCQIEQNIFYCNNQFLFYVEPNLSPQTYTMNYNCFYADQYDANTANVNYFYNTNWSYNYYLSVVNQNINSIFSNPQITNTTISPFDFHLLLNSPCINLGNQTMVDINETDFYGNPRLSGSFVDIGASEYQFPLSTFQGSKLNISVTPNPASEFVNVNFDNATNNSLIKVYSIQGKKLLDRKVKNNEQVDISQLLNGLYFVEIEVENEKQIFKFLVKH